MNSFACLSRWPLALALCVALLAGCASAPAAEGELRILAKLPPGTVADDPAWLARLAASAGTELRFAAAVSEHWAAYTMHCPPADAACDGALRRLQDSGILEAVQADRRKTHQ